MDKSGPARLKGASIDFLALAVQQRPQARGRARRAGRHRHGAEGEAPPGAKARGREEAPGKASAEFLVTSIILYHIISVITGLIRS